MGYVLLILSGLVLVVRRQWPAGVFALVAAISAGYYLLRFPDGPGWTSLFVALYTCTAYDRRGWALSAAAAALTGLTAVWLATAQLRPLNAPQVTRRLIAHVTATRAAAARLSPPSLPASARSSPWSAVA